MYHLLKFVEIPLPYRILQSSYKNKMFNTLQPNGSYLTLSNSCILYLWVLYDSHCKQRLFT
jgi:hypothetical protein